MRLDALDSSHPISVEVSNPDEISEIFDSISYLKGASIIRMMNHFLGEHTFRMGLSEYLKTLKYSSATQDDLWFHLNQQAHLDGTLPNDMNVKDIMDTWTLQMGFPVVTVTRDYDSGSAVVTQDKFSLGTKNLNADSKWWVPLTYCVVIEGKKIDVEIKETHWLKPHEPLLTLENLPDSDTPVIFNLKQTGFYRVNYDSDNWDLLKKQLLTDHTIIDESNRGQIVDDVFALAQSGKMKYSWVLDVMKFLEGDTSYIAWSPANRGMSFLGKMLKRTPAYGNYRVSSFPHFVKKLISLVIFLEIHENPCPTSIQTNRF